MDGTFRRLIAEVHDDQLLVSLLILLRDDEFREAVKRFANAAPPPRDAVMAAVPSIPLTAAQNDNGLK